MKTLIAIVLLLVPAVVGQETQSLDELRGRAEKGDADAQALLGFMYFNGEGVPPNYAEAVRWSRKAADQGQVQAQYNLGIMYAEGRGVVQNHAEAARWYRKAAYQGDADAQYFLALMYENGQGVVRNHSEAARCLSKAADQGHAEAIAEAQRRALLPAPAVAAGQGKPEQEKGALVARALKGDLEAQSLLCLFSSVGRWGPTDSASLAKCWRICADQGESFCQSELGSMYEEGKGVPQDYAEAIRLYRKSVELR